MTKRKQNRLSPQEIAARPYARVLIPEKDGTYSAEILEFPGCYGEGDTPGDAIADLEKAAVSWIEAAIEQNQDIPEPLASYEYSGKINLRIPRSIHRQAAQFAQKDDISLNQFFMSAIAVRVGAEELYERLARRLEERLAFAQLGLAVNVVIRQLTTSSPSTGIPQFGVPVAPLIVAKQQQAMSTVDVISTPARIPGNG